MFIQSPSLWDRKNQIEGQTTSRSSWWCSREVWKFSPKFTLLFIVFALIAHGNDIDYYVSRDVTLFYFGLLSTSNILCIPAGIDKNFELLWLIVFLVAIRMSTTECPGKQMIPTYHIYVQDSRDIGPDFNNLPDYFVHHFLATQHKYSISYIMLVQTLFKLV